MNDSPPLDTTLSGKVIAAMPAALRPNKRRLRHMNWTKMSIWVGAISTFWVAVQHLIPDWLSHWVSPLLLATTNTVMFMMKSQKDYNQTGERRGES